MSQVTLFVKYYFQNRLIRSWTFEAQKKPILIGSERTADIQICGPGVATFHAVLEHRNGQWFIFDFGSQTGTWVDKQAIVEKVLSDETTVHIADHRFVIEPKTFGRALFENSTGLGESQKWNAQEVVIKSRDQLLETFILEPRVPVRYLIDGMIVLFIFLLLFLRFFDLFKIDMIVYYSLLFVYLPLLVLIYVYLEKEK